jgi:hypothetical protein
VQCVWELLLVPFSRLVALRVRAFAKLRNEADNGTRFSSHAFHEPDQLRAPPGSSSEEPGGEMDEASKPTQLALPCASALPTGTPMASPRAAATAVAAAKRTHRRSRILFFSPRGRDLAHVPRGGSIHPSLGQVQEAGTEAELDEAVARSTS